MSTPTIAADSVFRSVAQRRHAVQFGVWCFLATVTMLFAAFSSSYIVRQSGADWTPTPLPSVLWFNMWFSRPIDGLAPGETLRFHLREFTDEHGQAFRAGGFFATREPERLVLAELETDEGRGPVLLRLIVVGQTEGQR